MKIINRREFLHTIKSFVFSLIIWGVSPFSLNGENKDSALMSGNKKKKNILVLYASYHGSTAQIAKFMGEKLNNEGITTSVKSIKDDIDFSAYYGIIMGAPIHRGKWMDDAVVFVNKHRNNFDYLPFACFYTCMSQAKHPPSKDTLDELASYQSAMIDLFPTLSPSHIGSFAGKLDYDKCSFLTKLVMWYIMSSNDLEAGDYRDWQAIEDWMKEIRKNMISEIIKKNVDI